MFTHEKMSQFNLTYVELMMDRKRNCGDFGAKGSGEMILPPTSSTLQKHGEAVFN